MNDYVLDHDWGCYDRDESINKLMLRNEEDFIKYFNTIINELFVAEVTGNYKLTFTDGTIFQVKIISL